MSNISVTLKSWLEVVQDQSKWRQQITYDLLDCNWTRKFRSQRTSHMEPSVTSTTVTGPVGERLQAQGRSDGGISVYIGPYIPKISNRFVHVWDINTCFEIAMTS